MLNNMRFEYKYRITPQHCYALRAAIRPYLRHDRFSKRATNQRYNVRSLYFDCWKFGAYNDKMDGVANRIKLRLRTYAQLAEDSDSVKVELKTREGLLVNKFSESIPVSALAGSADPRAWTCPSSPVVDEFRRLFYLRQQRPVLLVDYQREAWIPNDGSDVRVTFDHAISFARATELFPSNVFFQSFRPSYIVLELKFRDQQPEWLQRLVRSHALGAAPNSKYGCGIEQTQHAMFV